MKRALLVLLLSLPLLTSVLLASGTNAPQDVWRTAKVALVVIDIPVINIPVARVPALDFADTALFLQTVELWKTRYSNLGGWLGFAEPNPALLVYRKYTAAVDAWYAKAGNADQLWNDYTAERARLITRRTRLGAKSTVR